MTPWRLPWKPPTLTAVASMRLKLAENEASGLESDAAPDVSAEAVPDDAPIGDPEPEAFDAAASSDDEGR